LILADLIRAAEVDTVFDALSATLFTFQVFE